VVPPSGQTGPRNARRRTQHEPGTRPRARRGRRRVASRA
jgi:hypothetical protein